MSKITPLMTSLHEGHKANERLKCIDNMLFNKCEDTKLTVLQAFWWYRKNSIPLDQIKHAREEIESNKNTTSMLDCAKFYNNGLDKALEILDKLIESEEKEC